MIKTEDIIKIANYFTIIAHTPGRLRVRVNPKIKNEKGATTIALSRRTLGKRTLSYKLLPYEVFNVPYELYL